MDDPFESYVTRYFGERWHAGMFEEGDVERVPFPTEPCILCAEPFGEGDRGYFYASGQPVHRECGFRAVAGGLNHLKGTCSCKGGSDPPDPPGLTEREAAQASWDWMESQPGIR